MKKKIFGIGICLFIFILTGLIFFNSDSFKEKKFGEKKVAGKNDANEFPKLYLVSTAASRDVVEEKVDTILGKLNDGWLNWR